MLGRQGLDPAAGCHRDSEMSLAWAARARYRAGAGGGGFLLLYCEPELQDQVTEALEGNGLSRMDFRFESGGAMVIMNTLAGKVGALAKPAHV